MTQQDATPIWDDERIDNLFIVWPIHYATIARRQVKTVRDEMQAALQAARAEAEELRRLVPGQEGSEMSDTRIAELEAQVSELLDRIETLELQVMTKDGSIKDLQTELEACRAAMAQYQRPAHERNRRGNYNQRRIE